MLPRARIALVAVAVLVVGCSATTTVTATSTDSSMVMASALVAAAPGPAAASRLLSPAAFAAALAQPGTVSIDVHIPFQGRIAGTDLTIPYNEVAQQSAKLPADHATELALYCRTGVMSAIAAKTLASMGYTDIVQLQGGMLAWQSAGRALLQTP